MITAAEESPQLLIDGAVSGELPDSTAPAIELATARALGHIAQLEALLKSQDIDQETRDHIGAVISNLATRHIQTQEPSGLPVIKAAEERQGTVIIGYDADQDYSKADAIGYIQAMCGRYPPLAQAEMADLCRDIEAGVLAQEQLDLMKESGSPLDSQLARDYRALIRIGEKSSEMMMNHNMRLVYSIARRYASNRAELAELFQDGMIGIRSSGQGASGGLIGAIRAYDAKRGFTFATYATQHIKRAVTLSSRRRGDNILIADDAKTSLFTYKRTRDELYEKLKRRPTDEELMSELDWTERKLQGIKDIDMMGGGSTVSGDRPLNDDAAATMFDMLDAQGNLGENDVFPAPEETVVAAVTSESIFATVAAILDEKDYDIYISHSVNGETMESIGMRYGISRQAIQHRITISKKKLQRALNKNELGYL